MWATSKPRTVVLKDGTKFYGHKVFNPTEGWEEVTYKSSSKRS
jgi:hypothetical protein